MIIGVPKEIKNEEHRVGLLPDGAARLISRGHQVVVERGAGRDAGFPDEDYAAAGAQIAETHAEPFLRAELIVKVKEPVAEEYGLLDKSKTLFTYLHLAANRPLTDALLQSGVTAIAYETVTRTAACRCSSR